MIKLSILTPVWNQEELVIKGLDTVPRRDDIEIIVRDDGSDDNTLTNLRKYKDAHPELNMTVQANDKNYGVAYTANRLLEGATGEYFHFFMSDDYLYTEQYNELINRLYNTDADVLCMDLIENSGYRYDLGKEKEDFYCAQACRFIKRSFVEGIKYHEKVKAGEDGFYHVEMMKRNPKVEYTHIPAYHYNFPRKGSLVNLRMRGLINAEDLSP